MHNDLDLHDTTKEVSENMSVNLLNAAYVGASLRGMPLPIENVLHE